jgi:hypothetical protein
VDDDQQPSESLTEANTHQGGPTRRYAATRVRPRVEFGRREQSAQPPSSERTDIPEVIDRDTGGGEQGGYGVPSGSGDMFGGREFAGGRVRVYGCSPGCLIISLVVSLLLTLLLNALF